ncbi:uncharacterized protein LOC131428641 [Malaya genurostris]|uniref:uncharacterized protein LOC131428641 n=1 Tax=Malaya genurostris TaxID=325434 RepID=UPI0026F39690|nr:uncharacterized protein LOC131428641 [Malaya genurostris]
MAKTKKNIREKRYTEEGVQKCLNLIRSGISFRSACIRFGIPRSTIKFRMSKNYKQQIRSGPPTAFRSEQETELVNWILKMARKGFPVTKYRLINSVMNYLEHNPNMNVFKNGKPSKYFFSASIIRLTVCITNRILQPLDVAVFKAMKSSWLKVVDDRKCLDPNKYLKTENFAPLLAKAIKSVESKIIQNGFKACGLYPFNENNIDYSKCLAHSRPVGENFENKRTDTRQITSLTFPIVRSKAVEILTLIGPDRISLYKRNNSDDFPSDEDKILARVYKLLEPLDSSSNMNIPGNNCI